MDFGNLNSNSDKQDVIEDRIFLSIASFCDPLLWYTIDSAIRKSFNPRRLVFSIVDQSAISSTEYKKVSKISKVHYKHIDPVKSAGACWARNLAMAPFSGEEFFLQIDSHTVFDKFWDLKLIIKHRKIESACQKSKFVISTRPMAFNVIKSRISRESNDYGTIILKPLKYVISRKSPVVEYDSVFAEDQKYYKGFQISAAFLFSSGSLINELPYDPAIYFHGEEQNYSLRLFCAGWDIWHAPKIPLYHLYKKRTFGEPLLHWDKNFETARELKWYEAHNRSSERLYALYKNEIKGKFGLLQKRTVEEFLNFSTLSIE